MKSFMITTAAFFFGITALAGEYDKYCSRSVDTVAKTADQTKNDFLEKNVKALFASQLAHATGVGALQVHDLNLDDKKITVAVGEKLTLFNLAVKEQEKEDEDKNGEESKESQSGSWFHFGDDDTLDIVTDTSIANDKTFDKFGNLLNDQQVVCAVETHFAKERQVTVVNPQTSYEVVTFQVDPKTVLKNYVVVPIEK